MKVDDQYQNGVRFVGSTKNAEINYHTIIVDSIAVKDLSRISLYIEGGEISLDQIDDSAFAHWVRSTGRVNGMQSVFTSESGSFFKIRLDGSFLLQVNQNEVATLYFSQKIMPLPADGDYVQRIFGPPTAHKVFPEYR